MLLLGSGRTGKKVAHILQQRTWTWPKGPPKPSAGARTKGP